MEEIKLRIVLFVVTPSPPFRAGFSLAGSEPLPLLRGVMRNAGEGKYPGFPGAGHLKLEVAPLPLGPHRIKKREFLNFYFVLKGEACFYGERLITGNIFPFLFFLNPFVYNARKSSFWTCTSLKSPLSSPRRYSKVPTTSSRVDFGGMTRFPRKQEINTIFSL